MIEADISGHLHIRSFLAADAPIRPFRWIGVNVGQWAKAAETTFPKGNGGREGVGLLGIDAELGKIEASQKLRLRVFEKSQIVDCIWLL